MRARLTRLTVVAAVAAASLTGCGLTDRVVGLTPVPAEVTGGAPLNELTAQSIGTRVLSDADAARASGGKAGEAARRRTMTGMALTEANAAATVKQATTTAADPLSEQSVPTVLAISAGRAWPRHVLATDLDQATNTQSLYVFSSDAATDPFVLAASVPMHGGSAVPALGPVAEGVQVVRDGTGLVGEPGDLLKEYAAALAYPKPARAGKVATDDLLAKGVTANAVLAAKTLGKLGTFTRKHDVVRTQPIAFRLKDGGAVVFGQLTRTDVARLSKAAKDAPMPDALTARLTGKKRFTRSLTITSLESVVMIVPTSGKATVIGAAEQVTGAKAS